ncbi:MAG: HoxN/HupN/NixA family nickel/cobalt transporter [Methylovirgula sp.]
MGAFILLLHVAGWGTLLGIVARQHLSIGNSVFGFGIGLAAYALGMRHAFDADHIAAIDNTTRKIMQTGKRPLSVGFWFSFGHSTVVFVLALLLAFGVKSIAGPVLDDKSQLHQVTGLIGTIVSSGFLYVIAIFNLMVLFDIIRVFRQMRRGQWSESVSDTHHVRGIMSTLLRRVMNFVNEPWQMYFIGLLFGLGFDTATEIALLVLTGSGAASGLPWYAILCLPVLFAAGMSLFDTIDGSFMTVVYAWALTKPVRRVYYNLSLPVFRSPLRLSSARSRSWVYSAIRWIFTAPSGLGSGQPISAISASSLSDYSSSHGLSRLRPGNGAGSRIGLRRPDTKRLA